MRISRAVCVWSLLYVSACGPACRVSRACSRGGPCASVLPVASLSGLRTVVHGPATRSAHVSWRMLYICKQIDKGAISGCGRRPGRPRPAARAPAPARGRPPRGVKPAGPFRLPLGPAAGTHSPPQWGVWTVEDCVVGPVRAAVTSAHLSATCPRSPTPCHTLPVARPGDAAQPIHRSQVKSIHKQQITTYGSLSNVLR
jgi:hypothetical protein